jgi:hypothetical protein
VLIPVNGQLDLGKRQATVRRWCVWREPADGASC